MKHIFGLMIFTIGISILTGIWFLPRPDLQPEWDKRATVFLFTK